MPSVTIYHLSARADCFPDVVEAFKVLLMDHLGEFRVIAPKIKGFLSGEAELEFWTQSTVEEIQKAWKAAGVNHILIESLTQTDKNLNDEPKF
jgi:hypothetical protein